jgi:hypothetical protein
MGELVSSNIGLPSGYAIPSGPGMTGARIDAFARSVSPGDIMTQNKNAVFTRYRGFYPLFK